MVAVDVEWGNPVDFINSGVEQFAAFLTLFQGYRLAAGMNISDDELEEVVGRMEARMRAEDPAAFENPEGWWSVVLGEIKRGMM